MSLALGRGHAGDTKGLTARKPHSKMHNLILNTCGSPGWAHTVCLPQQWLLGPGDKDTCSPWFGYLRPLAANFSEQIFNTAGLTVACRWACQNMCG